MVPPRRSERILMRRSILVSGGLHFALLVAVLLRLPVPVPKEPPPPPTIEMEFAADTGTSTPHKGDKPAPKPAPAPAPVKQEAPPSPTPPEKEPNEEAAPPPPPPPPMPPPQQVSKPVPDAPTPPREQTPSPDAVKLPPTPPKAAPAQAHAPVPPSAQPDPTAAPKVQEQSRTTQPNEAKKHVPDTHSLLATLDTFRADQKQTHPPKARPNPQQGGAPDGGGSPDGDITSSMTATEQKAIGNSVRRCYSEDTAARNYAQFVAHLVVTVDGTGMARMVDFAPQTQAQMEADPSYRALAERARDAVLSPTCAKLPIPQNLLGQTRQLKFVFRP
ncbi:energy transducer TonB [Komagataeibacter sucrofermentans]|uniref:Energy transducer TonB n=1 Tax=Komagataeibacter sucrofermentans TaxID=1053551 RepID=A0A318QIH2_9PROT|nr:energy transducer TonB [Komagataeibacter sucrofermentans]PYD79316.1 energy transducer TonB [Komagataeibacter sucrofermentans]GBQ43565.1 TonB periplasmic protein [Komagataeibacter sucrofermentans DSM 15973]